MTGDPKELWREQPKESPAMNLNVVRQRLAAQQGRVRRSRWVLAAIGLAGFLLTAAIAFTARPPVLRVGEALMAAGFVAIVVCGWPKAIPPQSDDASECATYLRNRLIEQRRVLNVRWLLYAAPLVPGLFVTLAGGVWLAGEAWLPKLSPIIFLLLVWVGALLIILRRNRIRIEAEIAELDRLRLS